MQSLLLSLPEEMIANFLKKLEFEEIKKLRKINSQIDRIAVKYGLDRYKVESFSVSGKDMVVEVKLCPAFPMPEHTVQDRAQFQDDIIRKNLEEMGLMKREVPVLVPGEIIKIKLEDSSLMEVFDQQLNKVRPETIYFQRYILDENWQRVMENFKFTGNVELDIWSCDIQISWQDLVKVIKKFKNSKIYMIGPQDFFSNDELATDRVLCALMQFAEITWKGGLQTNKVSRGLTDETLRMFLDVMPSNFNISNHITAFTIQELIETIEDFSEIISERKIKDIRWNLGCVKVDSQQEVFSAAAKLSFIPGIYIAGNDLITYVSYEIENNRIIFEILCE